MHAAIRHLRSRDPVLAKVIDRVGPGQIEFRAPSFETLVRSIVFQQLSGKVARVIYGRLEAAMPGRQVTPHGILKLRPDRMRRLGLSRQKTAYIRDLARQTAKGKVAFEVLPKLPDEEVIARLTMVKGIGVWTAHMFLIFALRRDNVLPTGDLGVRVAIKKAYGLTDLPKPKEIEELARGWHPYCTAAAWYLWRSLDGQAGI
ncbi:MAG TPA: DNA-3-methyladenine glycosylase [Candidatus Acidoferrum sp.]|nr:DNA-3-methyladenine glycosylase [Candidatus Acidoferrum sp.]